MALGYILWPFGKFGGNLAYFSPHWCIVPRKIWQPWFAPQFHTPNTKISH
jgi:hypothetical protein